MRPRALALLAVLLLAGCASPTDGGAPTGTGADGGRARFAVVDLGAGGPEAVLSLAADGTVYVAAQDARGGAPRVWTSRDGAATFTMSRPSDQPGGEVDVAAGPGGDVYVTQRGAQGTIVSVSTDHGATWRTSELGAPTQYFDRQLLAVDAQGRAYSLARDFGAQSVSASVSRSDNKGLTWLPRGAAWDASNEPGVNNGNLVEADGVLYLAYVCLDGEGVCMSTSRDGGVTWTQSVAAQRAGNVDNVYPILARTPEGVVIAWSDATSGALAVYSVHSSTGAGGWSEPVRVSPASGTATLPWVASGPGATWIVYLGADAALPATDAPGAEGAAWRAYAVRVDARGANPDAPLAVSDEALHTGILSKPVGGSRVRDRNFGDFFTAAVDTDGRLLVAASRDMGTPESTRDLVFVERR